MKKREGLRERKIQRTRLEGDRGKSINGCGTEERREEEKRKIVS